MRSKRLAVLLGLVLVLALMLSACAPPATPVSQAPAAEQPAAEQPAAEQPPAQAEPVTVTWAFWGSPEEAASHQLVADAFMKEHPEIAIEVWNQPWDDYFTKIQALWASGDSEDDPRRRLPLADAQVRGRGRAGEPGLLHRGFRL